MCDASQWRRLHWARTALLLGVFGRAKSGAAEARSGLCKLIQVNQALKQSGQTSCAWPRLYDARWHCRLGCEQPSPTIDDFRRRHVAEQCPGERSPFGPPDDAANETYEFHLTVRELETSVGNALVSSFKGRSCWGPQWAAHVRGSPSHLVAAGQAQLALRCTEDAYTSLTINSQVEPDREQPTGEASMEPRPYLYATLMCRRQSDGALACLFGDKSPTSDYRDHQDTLTKFSAEFSIPVGFFRPGEEDYEIVFSVHCEVSIVHDDIHEPIAYEWDKYTLSFKRHVFERCTEDTYQAPYDEVDNMESQKELLSAFSMARIQWK